MQKSEKIEMVAVRMYPDGRMDSKNAALYLGLEEKTLAMKRSDGTGPCFIKRGRRLRAAIMPWSSAKRHKEAMRGYGEP